MKDWEQLYRVNWIDGMKINKGHFIQSENALLQSQYFLSHGAIGPNQYGLMPNASGNEGQLRIWISEDNQRSTTVKILTCKAITSSGVPVFISSSEAELEEISTENTLLSTSIDGEEEKGKWPKYLVLQVKPFERTTIGESSMEETPPRKPFVTSKYTLSLLEQSEMDRGNVGQFHLPVAKFIKNIDGFVKMEEDYIPPCIAISSHRRLVKEYNDLEKGLGSLERSCLQILQKVNARKQHNTLSEIMVQIIYGLMNQIPSSLQRFKHELSTESPVRVITELGSIARIFKNYADVRIGSGKEELFNYLSEWCGLNPNALETRLDALINHTYKHYEPLAAINACKDVLDTLVPMFKKLSELEYIGKRDSGKLFIKEYQIENEKKPDTEDSSISFLAE